MPSSDEQSIVVSKPRRIGAVFFCFAIAWAGLSVLAVLLIRAFTH